MYLRFASEQRDRDRAAAIGLFQLAYELKHDATVSPLYEEEIGRILAWFALNLRQPPRFNRTRSKAWRWRNASGICWFKPTAARHLMEMHALAVVVRECGHQVHQLKTARPGYLIYEDAYQVVAEPFRDTF